MSDRKFLYLPFLPQRLYASGDRVRWNEQGEVEYIDRVDGQLKLRGYRIEAFEVESAIKRVEGVGDAVVLLKQLEQSAVLVAFVCADTTEDKITVSLKASLPDYMLPNRIIFVESVPLTAVGKIDRQALLDIAIGARLSKHRLRLAHRSNKH